MKPPAHNLVVVVFTTALLGLAGTGAFVAIAKGQAPDQSFKDCDDCPEMVVVPAGSFVMGDLAGRGLSNERPVHGVAIRQRFAMGKYEVTFAEWDACAAAGGCNGHRPGDKGWGRGRRPVINVSWDDAKVYVAWLSRKTGKDYRLPSEAEWEYAARAGTTTKYHFGDDISRSQANYGRKEGKTVPVGSYGANAFGLHDMHGNVWEWVEDCLNGTYAGAPADGGAWTTGNCRRRLLRGGAWNYHPGGLRTAIRGSNVSVRRIIVFGFRVARTF